MKRNVLITLAVAGASLQAAGETPWSVRAADAAMRRHPASDLRWGYETGLLLKAIAEVWKATGDGKYFDYVRSAMDGLVTADGAISGHPLEDYNLDKINPGKILLVLSKETGDVRYSAAVRPLIQQLSEQPRTREGGFWHKKRYPHQMWLDGIYMACPFLAELGIAEDPLPGDPLQLDTALHQIRLIAEKTRDERTGLHYHGWDESRTQAWANPVTGCSSSFWGRAMGWYAMGIVDTLDFVPADHLGRQKTVRIFRGLMASVAGFQDAKSGVWYQVVDQGDRPGNYLEASASGMFVYAMAKGVRKGCLDRRFLETARRGYDGMLKEFVRTDAGGEFHLERICRVAGLGGSTGRDGSFEYYLSEPVVADDRKGVGPFILASIEMERARRSDSAPE